MGDIRGINDLHDHLLEENIELLLVGEISFDGDMIKWIYDGLGKTNNDMESHLEDIMEKDVEVLNDLFIEESIDHLFFTHEPEFNDSVVFFYISEE